MDLDRELAATLTTELARELIVEDHGAVDEASFKRVVDTINGEGGSGNAFDAPILYAMLELMEKKS